MFHGYGICKCGHANTIHANRLDECEACSCEEFSERDGKGIPYPDFCHHFERCRGLGSCPRDPVCCD